MIQLTPPTTDEYAAYYGDYIRRAIQRDDVFAALSAQIEELFTALDPLTDI